MDIKNRSCISSEDKKFENHQEIFNEESKIKAQNLFSMLIFERYQKLDSAMVKKGEKVFYGLKDGKNIIAKETRNIWSLYNVYYEFWGTGKYYSESGPNRLTVPIFRKRNKFEVFFLKLRNKIELKKRILKSRITNVLGLGIKAPQNQRNLNLENWEKDMELVQNLSEESCLEFIDEYEANQSKEKREFSNYGNKPITDLKRKGFF